MGAVSTRRLFLVWGIFFSYSVCGSTPPSIRIYDLETSRGLFTAIVVQSNNVRGSVGTWGMDEFIYEVLGTFGSLHRRMAPKKAEWGRALDSSGLGAHLSKTIYAHLKTWLLSFYEKKGLFEQDAEHQMREMFEGAESLEAGESTLVAIAEHTEFPKDLWSFRLGNVLSMLRVVSPATPQGFLPAEERVQSTAAQGLFARLSPEFRTNSELIWMPRSHSVFDGSLPLTLRLPLNFEQVQSAWWYSATAELKNFARVEHIDLLEPMLQLAVAHGAMVRSATFVPSTLNVDPRLAIMTAGGVQMWPGNGEFLSRIGQLVLECDGPERMRFFRKKGFHVVRKFPNPHMPNSVTYWMSASIEEFNSGILPTYVGKLYAADGNFVTLKFALVGGPDTCSHYLVPTLNGVQIF